MNGSANWWEDTVGYAQGAYCVLDEKCRCPDCGGQVSFELDCPGWGNPLMVCQGCGNADLFTCLGEGDQEGCGWSLRRPNRRPSARGTTPDWIDAQGLNGPRSNDWLAGARRTTVRAQVVSRTESPSLALAGEFELVPGAVDVNEDDDGYPD